MSDKNLARRAEVEVAFDGVDITSSIKPYLLSMSYTDVEEDEADDLQIKLQDRDGIWMESWLGEMIDAAADKSTRNQSADDASSNSGWSIGDEVIANGQPQYTSYGTRLGATVTDYKSTITHLNLKNGVPYPICVGSLGWFAIDQVRKIDASGSSTEQIASTGLKIQAVIVAKNWNGDGKDRVLDCGQFELDNVKPSGPPSVVTVKATALPFTSSIRQTEKSKAWEAYYLSGIANEMAVANGMSCMYLSGVNPYYARVEQYRTSDINFLSTLCHQAGMSLKTTNNILVLFDQADYESKDAVLTIRKGDGSYTKYDLDVGRADTEYSSCRVSYTTSSGRLIEGFAYVEDYKEDSSSNQQLEIQAKVSGIAEAETLAAKMLRLHNKYQKTAIFTIPGNPELVAGLTVQLEKWGAWDGKYMISQAKHDVGSSYTTQIKLRKILEGY